MAEDYGSDFITLTDDEGNDYELEHLDTLEYKGSEYMAFVPADESEDAEEVEIVILKAVYEGEEEVLVTVDDDTELEEIYNLFMERLAEDEEIEEP